MVAGGGAAARQFPRYGLDRPAAFWWEAERAFVAAASSGGAIVREGVWSNILVLRSADSNFAARLHIAGAWLLLNPKALDACLKEKT